MRLVVIFQFDKKVSAAVGFFCTIITNVIRILCLKPLSEKINSKCTEKSKYFQRTHINQIRTIFSLSQSPKSVHGFIFFIIKIGTLMLIHNSMACGKFDFYVFRCNMLAVKSRKYSRFFFRVCKGNII